MAAQGKDASAGNKEAMILRSRYRCLPLSLLSSLSAEFDKRIGRHSEFCGIVSGGLNHRYITLEPVYLGFTGFLNFAKVGILEFPAFEWQQMMRVNRDTMIEA
jgi:hypothetical protein